MATHENVDVKRAGADGGVYPAGFVPPMIPPAHASRLKPSPVPPGADAVYAARYRAAVACVSVALVWITPDDARWLLEHRNTRNRPLRSGWRRLLAKIADGVFMVNGEAIIFDSDGIVMSGQHRLKAIATGTVAVSIICIFGIDPAAFSSLDQGAKRNGSDVLALLGEEGAKVLAPALAWATRHDGGGLDRGNWVSVANEAMEDALSFYPGIGESVKYAIAKNARRAGRLLSGGLLAFLHYHLRSIDPAAADRYFSAVIEGLNIAPDSWEYIVRRRLTDMTPQSHFTDQIVRAALFIKGFNFSRRGRPISKCVRKGVECDATITWNPNGGELFPSVDSPSIHMSNDGFEM